MNDYDWKSKKLNIVGEDNDEPHEYVDDLTFRQKLSRTWRGKTDVGRVAGTILDFAELLPVKGAAIQKIRNRLRGDSVMDKPKLFSKSIWGAILIALTGILQALGLDISANPELMQAVYGALYAIGAGFGIYGLRDAAGKQIVEVRQLKEQLNKKEE